jgi:hypothetical protein
MHIAYVDESGDRGANGSRTYVLACVLVRSSQWAKCFDGIIAFRRFLKTKTQLPMRAEVKANYLVKNSGDIRPLNLSEKARRFIYRGLIDLQRKQELQTFAIVINKQLLHQRRPNADPMVYAWEYLIQRLENLTRRPQDQVMIFHDEGEPETIRKIARRFRRYGTAGSLFGGGGYQIPAFIGLMDDPVSRNSRHSYFLQLADLNAYAAFRRTYPPPQRTVQIVPQNTWDLLGSARRAAANQRAGGPSAGIVFWPRP